jgi:hypothetical protein
MSVYPSWNCLDVTIGTNVIAGLKVAMTWHALIGDKELGQKQMAKNSARIRKGRPTMRGEEKGER